MRDTAIFLFILLVILFYISILPPKEEPISIPDKILDPKKPAKEKASIILGKKDGKKNAIIITTKKTELNVDKPLTMVKLKEGGELSKPVKISAKQLKADFGNVLNASPLKPFSKNIFFKNGSKLTNANKKDILSIIDEIKKRQPCKVTINGYSDTYGTTKVNLNLSEKRVKNVKEFIEKNKVKMHSIKTSFFGESNQLVPTPNGVNEIKNRRAEIIIR